jgi:hypothetical protein
MDDLSARAEGSLWPTSQHAGATTDRTRAMSAPGSESDAGPAGLATDPPQDPDVEEITVDPRHLVRGES